MWRVVCTPSEARDIAAYIESIGWEVSNISRRDAMPLDEAKKKMADLKVVAAITRPSPFTEEGELTEQAKDDIRSGRMTATKDGKLIDPDAK